MTYQYDSSTNDFFFILFFRNNLYLIFDKKKSTAKYGLGNVLMFFKKNVVGKRNKKNQYR